jgi:hypothetical protein
MEPPPARDTLLFEICDNTEMALAGISGQRLVDARLRAQEVGPPSDSESVPQCPSLRVAGGQPGSADKDPSSSSNHDLTGMTLVSDSDDLFETRRKSQLIKKHFDPHDLSTTSLIAFIKVLLPPPSPCIGGSVLLRHYPYELPGTGATPGPGEHIL